MEALAETPLLIKKKLREKITLIGLDTRWVFLAVLGLSLVAVSGSYRPGVVHRLLIAVASLVVKHGL